MATFLRRSHSRVVTDGNPVVTIALVVLILAAAGWLMYAGWD
jgi:hypothetical protein